MNTTNVTFPTTCYIDETFEKHQIYIHHTASSADPFGVIGYWKGNHNKVGTPYLIAGKANSRKKWVDGEVFKLFPSDKGIWHLGLTAKHLAAGGPNHKTSKFLNLCSVGIELCNWGYLVEKNGKFVSYAGEVVPDSEIQEYDAPFRGYKHHHKYTDAQLTSLRLLLTELGSLYNIDTKYKGDAMFDIDKRALCGEPGIWSHVSVRPIGEKFDMHPQPELISMLKTL